MSRNPKRKPKNKKRARKQIMRVNRSDFLAPRETIVLTTVFNFVLNNATVLIPYGYSYITATQPLNSNAGASTVVPRWAELTQKYRKYRVYSAHTRVSCVNQEAYGVDFFVCPMNSLLLQTVVNCRAALSNRRAASHIVSGVGSPNSKVLSRFSNQKQYTGLTTRYVEDAYTGNTDLSVTPSDNWYFMVGVDTNGAASVAGVFVSIKMTWNVDLWEVQNAIN